MANKADVDQAYQEGRNEGYDEGLRDANTAAKDTFYAVVGWLQKRGMVRWVDFPDGISADDIVDALDARERELLGKPPTPRITESEARTFTQRS